MPVPSIPSASAAGKKSSKKSSDRARAGAAKLSMFAAGRGKQVYEAAVPVAEFAGATALASAVSGFQTGRAATPGTFIDGIQVGYGDYKVDGRLVAGLGALIFAMWKSGQTNPHALNIGTGFLTSWAAEKSFVYGHGMGEKMAARTATPPAPESTAVPAAGIVIGRMSEAREARHAAKEAGESHKEVRQAGRSARIAHRIEKLEGRRAKLGGDSAEAPIASPSMGRSTGGGQLGGGNHVPLEWILPQRRAQAQAFWAQRQAHRR